jgi:hypothetical protein
LRAVRARQRRTQRRHLIEVRGVRSLWLETFPVHVDHDRDERIAGVAGERARL